MAYKFQSGLARLGGEVHMDSALLVSGTVNLADKSLPIADLDINEGTNLGPSAAHTDELIIHDADADVTKKIRVVDLGQYLSGSDPTYLQVAGALMGQTSSLPFQHAIEVSGGLTIGTVTGSGQATLHNISAGQGNFTVSALGAVVANGVTADATISGAAGTFDALAGTSLALQGGGISAAGNVAGVGTLAASGLANLNGGIEVDSGGNKFTVSTGGAVVAEGSVSGAAGTFDALAGTSLALQGGGISAAGNVAGVGTLSGSGQASLHNISAGQGNFTVSALGAVVANGVTADATISGAAGTFDALAGTSLALQGGGISAAGNVAGVGTLSGSGQATLHNIVAGQGGFKVNALGVVEASQIGHADDVDLMVLSNGKLTINGDVDIQGAFNRITTNATELAVEDVRIIIGSGSAGASQLDEGGIFFGSPGAGKAIAEISFADAAEDELKFQFSGSEAMKIDAGGDLTIQGDFAMAGAVTGVTTLAASGLANLNGGIEVDSGGNKFTVSTGGAVVAEGSVSGAAGTFDALAGTSLALQGGGISAAGNVAGVGTLSGSGQASLHNISAGQGNFTVSALGAVVANGVTADATISGAAGTFDALAGTSLALQGGGISAAGNVAGVGTLSGSGAASFHNIAAGQGNFTVSALGAVAAAGIGAGGAITGITSMSSSGLAQLASVMGEFITDGTVQIASGTLSNAASVGSVALAISQTGSVSRLAPTTLQHSLVQYNSGSGPQEQAGQASGMLHKVSVSATASANITTFGGIPAGAGDLFTGSLQVAQPSSFVAVSMTGSECVKLFVPNLGTGDAGYTVSIKKQGIGEGQLVLTASAAASNVAFDGLLTELTLSSPMAAVNLVWNGTGYNIY